MITLNTISKYKSFLENKLSMQERKVSVELVRESDGKEFILKNVRKGIRIQQNNQLHAILGRLVQKGVLVKIARSKYCFKNSELVEHIKYRCLRMI